MRVYRSLPKFEARSEFSTWLYRITTNVCLTHGKRRKRNAQRLQHDDQGDGENEGHGEIGVSGDDPGRQLVSSEISDRIGSAMTSLSPQQKMIFTLKHYEGYKLREIADMLECSEGTVKKHLFTAVQRLRNQLKDLYE